MASPDGLGLPERILPPGTLVWVPKLAMSTAPNDEWDDSYAVIIRHDPDKQGYYTLHWRGPQATHAIVYEWGYDEVTPHFDPKFVPKDCDLQLLRDCALRLNETEGRLPGVMKVNRLDMEPVLGVFVKSDAAWKDGWPTR